MTWYDEMTWCDGCGVEITWGPVMVADQIFCCRDCARGSPCTCSERMEMDDEMRSSGAESAPAQASYLA